MCLAWNMVHVDFISTAVWVQVKQVTAWRIRAKVGNGGSI
jgi:hypothetical protein